MHIPPFDDLEAWSQFQPLWHLRDDTTYLNHGSFGPPPEPVRAARLEWVRQVDSQPMDFFFRRLESAWVAAREKLAEFVATEPERLVFVENATAGMNEVAHNVALRPGDQVVLTNHEYGAVKRIWTRACECAGADPPVIARLPEQIESEQQVVDAILSKINQKTRLLVISHVTSPTALILPVHAICDAARQQGVEVCIDGPHAPAQVPLNLAGLNCDYYTASCHKWLCAPFGSGFLSVAESHWDAWSPATLSWGRLLPDRPETWWHEFVWTGTRDPSAYLTIPTAIEFLEMIGLDYFRARAHALARYARQQLVEMTGIEPPYPDSPKWYGTMALVPLPAVDAVQLQRSLWREDGIEVPIIDFESKRFIRVSCHLYNTPEQIDGLVRAVYRRLKDA
jgi:isopenicillin-N epimerase